MVEGRDTRDWRKQVFSLQPLTRALQSLEQHISYLSAYYLLLKHTPAQNVWNCPDPVTHSTSEMYGLYILWFASCRDVLAWSRIWIFYIYHTRKQHKIEARTKDQVNYYNVQLHWHLEIHPFTYTSIRLQVLTLICVTIHGPRLKIISKEYNKATQSDQESM